MSFKNEANHDDLGVIRKPETCSSSLHTFLAMKRVLSQLLVRQMIFRGVWKSLKSLLFVETAIFHDFGLKMTVTHSSTNLCRVFLKKWFKKFLKRKKCTEKRPFLTIFLKFFGPFYKKTLRNFVILSVTVILRPKLRQKKLFLRRRYNFKFTTL